MNFILILFKKSNSTPFPNSVRECVPSTGAMQMCFQVMVVQTQHRYGAAFVFLFASDANNAIL